MQWHARCTHVQVASATLRYTHTRTVAAQLATNTVIISPLLLLEGDVNLFSFFGAASKRERGTKIHTNKGNCERTLPFTEHGTTTPQAQTLLAVSACFECFGARGFALRGGDEESLDLEYGKRPCSLG